MRPPPVSIALPCYNAAATLPACIRSLRAQTFADYEVLLVDDGSTDDTPRIASAYASSDPRVRVITTAHGGIVKALQAASECARGQFLARMDADDIAEPDRLRAQVDILSRAPEVGLCGTRVRTIGENVGPGRRRYDAWVNGLVTHEDMTRELFVECPIPHPTFMLRRDDFVAVGGYRNFDGPEDYDLVMRIVAAGRRLAKVDEVLLQWRHHENRLSQRSPRYAPERFRALKRHYLDQEFLRGAEQFIQWGAGEVGKAWLREWNTPRPERVVDINPRKFGKRIHGVTVIPPEALPDPGEVPIVVAVGAPGAREEIRAWLTDRNYVEQRDFLFIA